MKKHIILAGTAIAAVAMCWALWGGTATEDTVPTPAAESAVSAPCAPQTRPSEAEEPPAQDDMLYIAIFGHLKSEVSGKWSVSEDMYENANQVGCLGIS